MFFSLPTRFRRWRARKALDESYDRVFKQNVNDAVTAASVRQEPNPAASAPPVQTLRQKEEALIEHGRGLYLEMLASAVSKNAQSKRDDFVAFVNEVDERNPYLRKRIFRGNDFLALAVCQEIVVKRRVKRTQSQKKPEDTAETSKKAGSRLSKWWSWLWAYQPNDN